MRMRRPDLLCTPGLFILIPLGDLLDGPEPARLPQRPGYAGDFNAYLRVASDNRITC